MRRLLRLLPASTKLYLRIWQRRSLDFLNGRHRQMAHSKMTDAEMPVAIQLQQTIVGGDAAANKLHNLQLALTHLQGIVLQPGQLFSFWYWIGQPSNKKGYQKSRSIVRGQVIAETGGGLCQLSGLLYLLALKAGLTIIERHPHSLDIYREEERFSPLGSDATVSFGYKDLRFMNNLPHPIGLHFQIGSQTLSGHITSPAPIAEKDIRFQYHWQTDYVTVTTFLNDVAVNHTTYTRLHPSTLQPNGEAGKASV